MTLEIVSFAFGGLLILTGMLGGGLQVRELNIPRIGAAARGAFMAVGVLFIGIAVSINPTARAPASTALSAPTGAPTARGETISFRIHDELGVGQVSEQVKVVINGRNVGSITVSAMHRNSELLVVLPHEDRYSYQLAANAVFIEDGDKLTEYIGIGEGYINPADGMHFALEGEVSGSTWQTRLVQVD